MEVKNDQVILSLKEEIKKKKSLLEKNKKFQPVTNCNLELDGRRYNIHVADKETLLLLIGKIHSLKAGVAEVLPEEQFTIAGYTADQWLEDLASKFAVLNVSLEEKRLKALETKLHNLLSTDKKVELEIEDLKSQI